MKIKRKMCLLDSEVSLQVMLMLQKPLVFLLNQLRKLKLSRQVLVLVQLRPKPVALLTVIAPNLLGMDSHSVELVMAPLEVRRKKLHLLAFLLEVEQLQKKSVSRRRKKLTLGSVLLQPKQMRLPLLQTICLQSL